MFWTNTKRIIRSGFVSFWRNSLVSATSVFIMSITLFVIGSLLFVGVLLQNTLTELRDKVDVNIYFTVDAPEENILALGDNLRELPEVAEVSYTSREEALAAFRARHEDDFLTIQALEELDDNPLGASLSIRAKETSQYESVVNFLEGESALSEGENAIIDEINYYQNKPAIDRLTKIIDGAETIGYAVTGLLIVVSIIITFNTIRLAIYTAREEISVMRLVGADNKYVRGPFIIEGMMYGLFAAAIALALFFPVTYWLGNATEQFFGGVNLFAYYQTNFWQIVLILAGSGIVLGAVSSFLAVRKYLRK